MRGAVEAPTLLGWSPLLSLTQPSSEAGRLADTFPVSPEPQEVGVGRGQEQVQPWRAVCARVRVQVCVK